jgi:hypothetical protein
VSLTGLRGNLEVGRSAPYLSPGYPRLLPTCEVYDLVEGQASRAGEWNQHVQAVNRSVELQNDPGRGALSCREVEKLTEKTDRYRDVDDWSLSGTLGCS